MPRLSLPALINHRNSATGTHLFRFLTYKDGHAFRQVSQVFQRLYREQADFMLRNIDYWTMRDWYGLPLHRCFLKHCQSWLSTCFIQANQKLYFNTKIADLVLELDIYSYQFVSETRYIAAIDVRSQRDIPNPDYLEDGRIILARYASRDHRLAYFQKSLTLWLLRLPFLHMQHGYIPISIGGQESVILDVSKTKRMTGKINLNTIQVCLLLYYWLIAFPRETYYREEEKASCLVLGDEFLKNFLGVGPRSSSVGCYP